MCLDVRTNIAPTQRSVAILDVSHDGRLGQERVRHAIGLQIHVSCAFMCWCGVNVWEGALVKTVLFDGRYTTPHTTPRHHVTSTHIPGCPGGGLARLPLPSSSPFPKSSTTYVTIMLPVAVVEVCCRKN